jgi:hypothetical protein
VRLLSNIPACARSCLASSPEEEDEEEDEEEEEKRNHSKLSGADG